MEKIKYKLGFSNSLFVPSRGRTGGLALLWSSDTNLEIKSFSNNHIDAVITDLNDSFTWRFMGFYGHPVTHLRGDSWKLLSYLNNQYSLPWFCCGDFNEILSINEKAGGAQRSQHQMEGFRQAMNLCSFWDLGYCGPNFTWCNMQEGENRISLRLDRALATSVWLSHFGETRVHHLVESTSDHCILTISGSSGQIHRGKRRFHLEALWVKRDDCREIIESAWYSGSLSTTPEGIASNLQNVQVT